MLSSISLTLAGTSSLRTPQLLKQQPEILSSPSGSSTRRRLVSEEKTMYFSSRSVEGRRIRSSALNEKGPAGPRIVLHGSSPSRPSFATTYSSKCAQ